MATSPRNSLGNVRYDMDIAYPEPLSRLHINRHSIDTKCYYNPNRSTKNRRTNRYRTQPVTIDEMQELEMEEAKANDDKEKSDEQASPTRDSFSASKMELKKFQDSFEAMMRNQIGPDDNGAIPDAMNNVSNGAEAGGQTRWLDYTREGSV